MGGFRHDSQVHGADPDAARRRLALVATELGADRPAPPLDDVAPAHSVRFGAGPLDEETARGRHKAPALPAWRRLTGALSDQLPALGSRPVGERGVTGQHVTVVALLVSALVAAGAWWVLSGRPHERSASPPVQAQSSTATDLGAVGPSPAPPAPAGTDPVSASARGADPAATPPSAVDEAATQVVVDVAGRVRRPGLVVLPAGARVADALESAGGALPKVDLAAMNLARTLVDGEQLLVGLRSTAVGGAAPGSPSAPPAPGSTVPTAPVLIDLNTATMEQLDTLPGVGPVTGQSILDWRSENGAFTSVDELLEVDGIGDATLADLRDSVTVGPGAR